MKVRAKPCKCGHWSNHHKKSFWSGITKCNVEGCNCKRFLRRNFPSRSDKVEVTLGVVCFSFLFVIFGSFIWASGNIVSSTENPKLDEPVFTFRQFFMFAGVVAIIGFAWFSAAFLDTIKEYLRKKRTPTLPISPGEMPQNE